ncbi:hypothetical protein GCM10023081_40580 [Arthrobacter ginkgonis]|uniref:Uncharacterized protein n=1 Tax=Arthrobacter ginkgonis TaxID=1630594 RepID=A0ABP7D1S6_9MICC
MRDGSARQKGHQPSAAPPPSRVRCFRLALQTSRLRGRSWGHLHGGSMANHTYGIPEISDWQVTIKLGFRLETT